MSKEEKLKLPESVHQFKAKYPKVWDSFAELGTACHESGGPLDEKTRRLVKLGLAIGSRHEGAVHSAVRHAIESGCRKEELIHVAILAITTTGWPQAYAAMTWIEDNVGGD